MIHRLFFDIGHEDFDCVEKLFIKYPSAKPITDNKPANDDDTYKVGQLINGKRLHKYA